MSTKPNINAHKKLVDSELRYRRVFETAQDGILLIDYKTGMILDVNQFLIDMLGYSKNDFLKKHLWEVGVFNDIVASKENFETLQKKRYIRFEDLPLETKRGTRVDVEFVANAYAVDGSTIIQCNIRDITERKKAEYIAQVSELRYRRLFETAKDGILLIDYKTGMILDVNQFLIDLLDYSKKDFLEKHLWEVGVFKDIAASKDNFETLQKKKYVRFEDLPLVTKRGTRVDVEFVANAYAVDGSTIIQCNIRDITERKKAEKRFLEEKMAEKNKYRGLFETSRDAIMTIEPPSWNFTSGNSATLKMFKTKSEAKFISYPPWKLSPPLQPDGSKSSEKAREMIKIAMEKGSNLFEWTHRTIDGKEFFAEVYLSRVSANGEYFVQAIVRDITEQKRMQHELFEAEKKNFKNIFDSAADGIIIVDPETEKFVAVNPAACRMLGYSKKDLEKLGVMDIHPKKDLPYVIRVFKKQLRGDCTKASDMPVLKKDGRVFFADINSTKVIFEEKTCLMGFFHDNTDRLELEKARENLREAKEKVILSSIGDGVMACDINNKIIIFNSVASQITGFSVEEALGKDYHEIISLVMEDTGRPSKDFIAHAIKEGKAMDMANHAELVRKDGTKVPVADSAAPFFDLEHKIIGCVVVFRDVTHERAVDRAKTEFVSLASHQLRTPLTGINWLTEMLLREDLGKIADKQKESIEVISHSAKQMVELIGSLLNVSRLELSTFSINPVLMTLRKSVDEVLDELSHEISEKEIKITRDYPAKTTMVKADPVLLKVIYQNILSNAVRYAFPKTVLAIKIKKDDINILLKVTDQGIGISKEDKPKIFTKLYRANNAQLFVTDGTGLGLYIVKLVVDAVGGKIWFDSELNKKTSFYVSLPLSGMALKKGGKTLEIKSSTN